MLTSHSKTHSKRRLETGAGDLNLLDIVQDTQRQERVGIKLVESESNRTNTSEGIVRMPTLPRDIDVKVTPSRRQDNKKQSNVEDFT